MKVSSEMTANSLWFCEVFESNLNGGSLQRILKLLHPLLWLSSTCWALRARNGNWEIHCFIPAERVLCVISLDLLQIAARGLRCIFFGSDTGHCSEQAMCRGPQGWCISSSITAPTSAFPKQLRGKE